MELKRLRYSLYKIRNLSARKTKQTGLNSRNLDLSVRKLEWWKDRLANLKNIRVLMQNH
jgi:hypothetical protein